MNHQEGRFRAAPGLATALAIIVACIPCCLPLLAPALSGLGLAAAAATLTGWDWAAIALVAGGLISLIALMAVLARNKRCRTSAQAAACDCGSSCRIDRRD